MESEMDVKQTTTLEFPRFGACAFADTDVIEFPWGLPGFPNLRRWLALTIESAPNFIWLQSIDDVAVAIPTSDPYAIFADYSPKLPPYVVAALDIASASDFTLLGVVVVSEGAEEMTMNLLAPVVINLRTHKARQVMLENSGYSVREVIPRKPAAPAAEPAP
ncbi:MAG TPA: flagellar assembly protein FliW [Candidatus Baltobacteraceae bacterium]|nr:flagellar assembly protein FliW [Candidatus Baltobacteraceae bacterium]